MEIVEEEDWEGIIPVEGIILVEDWKIMPYSICRFHVSGFYDMAPAKRQGGKQLPADNGGSEILCSPRSRDFWHGSLRYASLFLVPICFHLFDVCDVCCCCYLHLLESNYILIFPSFNT